MLLRGGMMAAALTAAGSPVAAADPAAGLPTVDELWDAQLRLNDLGPRFTGNAAHRGFVDYIDTSLRDMGIQVIRDRVSFTRWEAGRFDLRLDGTPLRTAGYVPYSGSTGPEGVEGELVYAGTDPRDGFPPGSLQDRIVVTDARSVLLPVSMVRPVFEYLHDPDGTVADSETISGIALSFSTPLTVFRLAGARAVILVLDASPENAAGQYVPFLYPLAGMPGLIVDRETGARLRERARTGGRAHLTLEATVEPGATTDDVIGLLPGASDEISLINTHTDGPNAIEENGPLALLALARKLSAIPREQRRRSYAFLFATGHIAVEVGDTQRFIGNHPDLIRRAASALTIEHLGGLQWIDDPVLGYHATGQPDFLPLLTSQNPALWTTARDAVQANDLRRGVVIRAIMNAGMPGVGSVLNAVGVPTVAALGTPPYLLSWADNGHIDKLDPHLLHRQVRTCADILDRLDAAPRLDLALGGTLLQGGGQLLPEVLGAGWNAARSILPFAGQFGIVSQ
ncbi:hypothetical protein JMUB6875_28870 [Nocardia sp. JMUB6875]